ncbi:transposase [Nostoc sp. ATCC 43529]|nr:transposase [Nostoc sp. ATCC 43529]
MPKKHIVKLTQEQHQELLEIVKKGKATARTIRRAHTLLMASSGKTDEEIAKILHISVATVERTRKQFVQENLNNTLTERSRPGKPRKLIGKVEAFLIATTCSQPPTGHQRWTLQLLADKLISVEMVDSISADTVGRALKKTNLNLGSKNNDAYRK